MMVAVEYEIRVAGANPDGVLAGIADAEVLIRSLESTVTGPVPDLAALYGPPVILGRGVGADDTC